MRYPATKLFARLQRQIAAAAVSSLAALVAASPSAGQAVRIDVLRPPGTDMVSVEASSNETVRVLASIGEIRAALQLGMLFQYEGKGAQAGSHFSTPRTHIYPGIKEALAMVGAPDLEPLLLALETAQGKEAVTQAFSAVEGALQQGRAKLSPTSADAILAVHAMATHASAKINAAGPTDVAAYQDAWSIILSARSELDLLMRDSDPTIAKLAAEEAMLFDELIISLPDPKQSAAVAVDARLFSDLVARLETLNSAA